MVTSNSCVHSTLFTALTLRDTMSCAHLYGLITFYPQCFTCFMQPCSKRLCEECTCFKLFTKAFLQFFAKSSKTCPVWSALLFWGRWFEKEEQGLNSAYLKLAFSFPSGLLISSGDAYKLTFRCSFISSHHQFVHWVLTYSLSVNGMANICIFNSSGDKAIALGSRIIFVYPRI